mgnify:CR=1 FL=1
MQIPANSFIAFQLAGWLLYALIQILSFTIQGQDISKSLLLTAILTSVGLIITSVMRKLYNTPFIKRLKSYQLVLVCMFICLIAAALMTTVAYIVIAEKSVGGSSYTLKLFNELFIPNYFQVLPMFFIWTLLYFSIKYFRKLAETEIEKLKLEAALKESKLNTLKGQINPHFLFNNLNNIRALILEDVHGARDGLSSLAEVLRYSLSSEQRDKTAISDELVVVNDFIGLAKMHYEGKLSVIFNIQDECLSCLIPVMSLQMMVENAIKHGIAEEPNGGILEVYARCDENKLYISVSNPGTLRQLNKKSKLSSGTGVKNITQRLNLLYESDAIFELNQEGEKVVALLTLPKENME